VLTLAEIERTAPPPFAFLRPRREALAATLEAQRA